jgi:hypothetical protein
LVSYTTRHALPSATRTNGLKLTANSITEPSTTISSTSFASARIEIGQRDFSNGGIGMFSSFLVFYLTTYFCLKGIVQK